MVLLEAKNLTFEDVQNLFGFRESGEMGIFSDYLDLHQMSELESRELMAICANFCRYLLSGKVSEGQIKFIAIAPLMNLAGYYDQAIELLLEENIQRIEIIDSDILPSQSKISFLGVWGLGAAPPRRGFAP